MITMRRFTRWRNLKELRGELRRRKWKLNTNRLKSGSDYVRFDFRIETLGAPVIGYALVSVVNGRFMGELNDGRRFSSDETEFEDCRWFHVLLETVYLSEGDQ